HAVNSGDQSLNIDRLRLQWRNSNRHRERHKSVDFGSGFTLARFAVTCIVQCNHGVAYTHGKYRMTAMREVAFQKNLFQISQRRTHARNALAEFNEVLFDKLLAEACPNKPRPQMPEVPTIKSELLNVVALEHPAQIMGDEFVRDGFAWSELQMSLGVPDVV